jgi:hypothetical protein
MAEEITATKEIGGEKKTVVIYVDLGEDCEDAVTKFTGPVVFSNFKRSAVITAQAAMRRYMEAGKGQEEVAVAMKDWKPGVALERVADPVGALKARFATMTEEEKQEVINKLMEA